MDKQKSLYTLGAEYEEYASEIQAQIAECKKNRDGLSDIERFERARQLLALEDMLSELRMEAKHLKHYYDEGAKKL